MESRVKSIFPLTEDIVIKQSEVEQLKDIIFNLPKNYREIIYLYYYKSLTITEITEVTGLNPNSVKTRQEAESKG